MITPSPLDAIPREHLIEMLLERSGVRYTNQGTRYAYGHEPHSYSTPAEALLAHWRRCYPKGELKVTEMGCASASNDPLSTEPASWKQFSDSFPRHLEG